MLLCSIGLVLKVASDKADKDKQTKQDIALLDAAEVKMRSLRFPKADSTTYERSCSVRSVKFGDPGPPNCRVVRKDQVVTNSLDDGANKTMVVLDGLIKEFGASQGSYRYEYLKNNLTSSSMPTVDLPSFIGGLKCYATAGIHDDSGGKLNLTVSCYKRFLEWAYPES